MPAPSVGFLFHRILRPNLPPDIISLPCSIALYGALGQGSRHVEPPLEDDNDAVRTVLLESVHKRLEDERQAHARTKQEADAETLRLRAMVARRDAELEACATHSGHRVLLSSSLSTSVPSSSHSHQHFPRSNGREHHGDEFVAGPSRVSRSHESVAPVVSLAGARERTLEREVAFLQGQVRISAYRRNIWDDTNLAHSSNKLEYFVQELLTTMCTLHLLRGLHLLNQPPNSKSRLPQG